MSLRVDIAHQRADFALQVAFEARGGVTALFGRSGAGKTTVVNAVAGLLRADRARILSGDTVLVDSEAGVWVPPHKRRVGYVFQDARLFPHLDVRGNLAYGQRFAPKTAQPPSLSETVSLLGIGDLLDRRVGDLSGGETQRVAIGRALLSAPRLLLLDEPLAALDAARKAEILPYLERLRDLSAMPILYVSHQISEIARIATDVVALDRGRVLTAGSVTEVLSDPDLILATGVRDAGAVIAATVVAHHPDGLSEVAGAGGTLWLPSVAAAPGTRLRLRIEAQDVMLSRDRPKDISALNILPVTAIGLREGVGPGAMVQLQAGDARLLSRITARSAKALQIAPGWRGFAVIKSVAVAAGDVGILTP